MLTPSRPPSSSIISKSGHRCPHTGCIVRPSAMLSAMRHCFPPLSWCAFPDFSADRVAALSFTITSVSRKVGNTASTIKSLKACSGHKIFVSIHIYTICKEALPRWNHQLYVYMICTGYMWCMYRYRRYLFSIWILHLTDLLNWHIHWKVGPVFKTVPVLE